MLRITYRMRPRKLSSAEGKGSGPQGRINRMRKLVTALVRYERIEGKQPYLDEARGYAERLIQEAQKHGDTHKPTMELADYWLLEKDLIHKLFKVLVPRYTNVPVAYTSMWDLPTPQARSVKMSVLEFKGNPWPPVKPEQRTQNNSLVNILLDAAKTEYRTKKFESMKTDRCGRELSGVKSTQPLDGTPV